MPPGLRLTGSVPSERSEGLLESQPNLSIFQQPSMTSFLRETGYRRRTSSASASPADAVIFTAGTFLNGRIHVGLQNYYRWPRRRPSSLLCPNA